MGVDGKSSSTERSLQFRKEAELWSFDLKRSPFETRVKYFFPDDCIPQVSFSRNGCFILSAAGFCVNRFSILFPFLEMVDEAEVK